MKYILSLIIGGALVVSGFGQTRNVLVGTNGAVVQPTNFWSADAVNARSGLGLGTAATNPASAFQPASTNLTSLAGGDGSSLTNLNISGFGSIAVTNISGLQSALDEKLATNGSAANLTSFPATILQTTSDITNFPAGLLRTDGSALNLTNFPVIPVVSGGTGGTNAATARSGLGLGTTNTLTIAGLVSDNLTINSGGGIILQAALTNAANFRTNIGLPWSGLTSADAPTFRTALGLGTAATNPSSAFQPSSATLSNLATANGGSLTNLQATSLVGIIPASNISSVTFTNVSGTLAISSGGTGATNASDARLNLGATTVGNALFIATNATAARTAINALAPNGDATNLTNFPSSLLRVDGNGSSLTNLTAANINGTVALASNLSSPLLVANGGTGATNASGARTNLGLGTAATNPASAFQPSSAILSNLASGSGLNITNIAASNIVGAVAVVNGGTGATNAATARTNLGFTTVGNSLVTASNAEAALDVLGISTNYSNTVLSVSNLKITSFPVGSSLGFVVPDSGQNLIVRGTNTTTAVPAFFGWNGFVQTAFSAAEARTNLGLGATNAVTFGQLSLGSDLVIGDTTTTWGTNNRINYEELRLQGGNWQIDDGSLIIGGGTNQSLYQAQTRTNLGLPWGGLTNTNAATFQTALFGANTNPVLVDTNGEVVSPTNFWQVAPLTTTFIESQPSTNSTTNITAARFLHIHSLNTNIVNVTNTIALPTNGSTYNGDVALIVHQGPTNSMTRVRSVGSTNDIVTMTRYNEAIEFVYYNNDWTFNHNEAFTEPIYFAGTNAVGHAAESRTNLGLGATNDVTFNNVTASGALTATGVVTTITNLNVGGAIAVTNAAATRTNLGIGGGITTNLILKNGANVDTYMNFSNGILIYGSTVAP